MRRREGEQENRRREAVRKEEERRSKEGGGEWEGGMTHDAVMKMLAEIPSLMDGLSRGLATMI